MGELSQFYFERINEKVPNKSNHSLRYSPATLQRLVLVMCASSIISLTLSLCLSHAPCPSPECFFILAYLPLLFAAGCKGYFKGFIGFYVVMLRKYTTLILEPKSSFGFSIGFRCRHFSYNGDVNYSHLNSKTIIGRNRMSTGKIIS